MKPLIKCLTYVFFLVLLGCARQPKFPTQPVSHERTSGGIRRAYATDKDGLANYWQSYGPDGRVVLLEFGEKGVPSVRVRLDEIDPATCRHLVLMLDGVPFELMEEAYEQGMFRLFYPPSRFYGSFPSMTWLSFPLIFHCEPPAGIEASYLDPKTGRLTDEMAVYEKRLNEPWEPLVDYRAGTLVDAICYVSPYTAFLHELDQARVRFEESNKRVMFFYNGSSAGMGTKLGTRGFRKILPDIDRFCNEMMLRSRGRIAMTMFADHGHSLTPARRIRLKRFLTSRGYKPRDRIVGDKDVVIPAFGLVTFAAIYARAPEAVATDLLELEGTNLVVYPTGESITVRNAKGLARIDKRNGRYRYEAVEGDPLELIPIIDKLRMKKQVDNEGYIADRAAFDATSLHKYPDPLYRIWLCWHGAVQNPPDLIVTFDDHYYWGSEGFDFFAEIASTHGNLNFMNSVTFAMSTAGPLPPFMRLADLRPALEKYFPFPELN